MKKRQMTMDEFEEELRKQKASSRELKEEKAPETVKKIVHPYEGNIPKNKWNQYTGSINYTVHDDWWYIVFDDGTEMGAFTSRKSAMNWAHTFMGRTE